MSGRTAPARDLTGRAILMARESGEEKVLTHALSAALWVGSRPRDTASRRAHAEELALIAARSGDLSDLATAASFRAVTYYAVGDPEGFASAGLDLDHASSVSRQPYYAYFARVLHFARSFQQGDLAGAGRISRELSELGSVFGDDSSEGPYGVQTYMVRRESGRVGAVRPLVTGLESPTEHWAPGLLALYTELGMRGPATRLLTWLLDQDVEVHQESSVWPGVLAFLAEAACALQDRDAARRVEPLLREHAGRNLMGGWFDALFGAADRYLGAVTSLLGRPGADDWFEGALELDTRMGAPLHRAHTLAMYAAHVRGVRGREPEARSRGEQARALADELDLPRVLAMLPPAQRSGVRTDGLTPREVQVLRLLAAGAGNREISVSLGISENTAANHVRSILQKTASGNRTQAAMYAGRHGLLEPPPSGDVTGPVRRV